MPGTSVYLPRPSDWGHPLPMRPQALRGHSETGPGSPYVWSKCPISQLCSYLQTSLQPEVVAQLGSGMWGHNPGEWFGQETSTPKLLSTTLSALGTHMLSVARGLP